MGWRTLDGQAPDEVVSERGGDADANDFPAEQAEECSHESHTTSLRLQSKPDQHTVFPDLAVNRVC